MTLLRRSYASIPSPAALRRLRDERSIKENPQWLSSLRASNETPFPIAFTRIGGLAAGDSTARSRERNSLRSSTWIRGTSMSDQHRFLSADNFYCDAYSRCQTAESMLNTAITRAEISRSFEEYLEIVGRVFAIAGRVEEARKIAEVGHCTAGFFAPLLTPTWGWHLQAPSQRRNLSPRQSEDQFLSPYLAGRTQSGRNRRAARPHDWLRRMQHNRRAKPAGRESGFHLHGALRPEGVRTVIPHSA